ncbi:conserved hypothetical protein [Arcobacter nitrofigilis DSM 7299]|uniref:Uncharacterized protein n=1 Tax=Arcobacter nitrofigilis (strain ATCC 33309 / DSM 7299 / CCUG 15893 / LMG 7604 / NCTC 12251 / CI) TaxID=572480 RepID=D5V7A3_ARCNC|nr:hypothetical protein [Arcobacter nitrofigilis]ADG94523.1 conserved hypothetical protein [Arcobacter nitrofigilis DSM 7299]
MIVTVKNSGPKNYVMKIISVVALVAMFTAYYFHMSDEFSSNNGKSTSKQSMEEIKKEDSKEVEKLIYKEVETAVELVGQEHIQDVKIVKNKILLVCDTDTNLDALKVRYGTLALIKNDLNNIKIAIDIKYIIESKLNEK